MEFRGRRRANKPQSGLFSRHYGIRFPEKVLASARKTTGGSTEIAN